MTKRSSFNVSLQRKHNKIVLGPLIERSEQEGSVISDIIVEYVEKALDYEKVMGLNKVMQTYKLIQNMVTAQYGYGTDEYHRRIEDVLKRIIRIDGNELSMFLSDPSGYSGGDISSPLSVLPTIEPSHSIEAKEKELDNYPRENKTITPRNVQSNSEIEQNEEDEEIEKELELERRRQKRAEERKRKKAEKEALMREEETDDEDEDDIDIQSLNTGALFND